MYYMMRLLIPWRAILQELQEEVLPVALSLSHDSTAAVRASVAGQMGIVVQALWFSCGPSQLDATPNNLDNETPQDVSSPQEQTRLQSTKQSDQMTKMQSEVVLALHGLAQDESFQTRQQFIEICYHLACVSDHFAASVFRTHLLPLMLQLANDPVSNVRLTLARLLTQLSGETCSQQLQLTSTLDALRHDSDQDVVSCLPTVIDC